MGNPIEDRNALCDLISEGRIMYQLSRSGIEHGVFDVDVYRVLDGYEDTLRRCPDSHIHEVRAYVERFIDRMRREMRSPTIQS